MSTMDILAAVSDPKVFGPAFRDADTWSAWRCFLAALFGLPMDDEQQRIFTECTARTDRPNAPSNEAWLVCGRRSGKSFTLALIAVFLSCFRDWRGFLGPGECATVMIIAADRRQARTIVRYVKGLLKSVPMLAATIDSETQESITLTNRVVIEVHSCSFRAVRGYTVVACLADEIAFWTTDEGGANPDHEVLNAVRPAMATVPGSILLCASSPYARRGALWESYSRNFGKAGGPLVWQASTRQMNPTVNQAYIDAEYEKDPISAAAEFGPQFRTDIESFVSREAVEAVIDWGVRSARRSDQSSTLLLPIRQEAAPTHSHWRLLTWRMTSASSIVSARSGRRSPPRLSSRNSVTCLSAIASRRSRATATRACGLPNNLQSAASNTSRAKIQKASFISTCSRSSTRGRSGCSATSGSSRN
jgi:hypothetical protein